MIPARTGYRHCKGVSTITNNRPTYSQVSCLFNKRISKFAHKRVPLLRFPWRYRNTDENFSDIYEQRLDTFIRCTTRRTCTVVSVMEHGNIPVCLQTAQELSQCSRSLGELCKRSALNKLRVGMLLTKSEDPLVLDKLFSTDHMTHMTLRKLVIAQVHTLHSRFRHLGLQTCELLCARLRRRTRCGRRRRVQEERGDDVRFLW